MYKKKPVRMSYEAVVIMDITAQDGKTKINSVALEYDHRMPYDAWMEADGRYTAMGIDAMLFAFCSGITAIIHNASQINGMDKDALYRKAVGIIELQLAEPVRITQTQYLSDREHKNHKNDDSL